MKINLVEVGPWDGLQNERVALSTAVKVEMIERFLAAGIRRMEVASFVHPKRVPQIADAEDLFARLAPHAVSASLIGLVLNRKGLERALLAGCRDVGMVVVASDTFSRRNQGMSTEESIAAWLDIARAAGDAGAAAHVTIAAAFGCPFEGEVEPQRVLDIARRCAAVSPVEISLADTIGVAVPSQVAEVFGRVREALPGLALRAHFHNMRNTGIANA